jgi:hypothetical protein
MERERGDQVMKESFTGVTGMRADAINVNPVYHVFDFDEDEFYEAATCDTCGEVVENIRGEYQHHDQANTECDGWLSTSGPAMNYVYALPGWDPSSLIGVLSERLIAHLPLCIVRDAGRMGEHAYGLALTGGGMNFSWEICEAYMRLGYIPPVTFAQDLPEIGRGNSDVDQWIVKGAMESMRRAVEYHEDHVRHLRSDMRRVVNLFGALEAESE